MQFPVRQNFRPQSPATFQEFFRARCDGAIHPIAWPAFLRAVKTDALHFKILADQFVKIGAAHDDVAPHLGGRPLSKPERLAKLIENTEGKKCDLAFVVVFEIEVAIPANAAASHTFDHRHLDYRVSVRLATVMTDKIVSRRNVKMADFHRAHDNIEWAHFI